MRGAWAAWVLVAATVETPGDLAMALRFLPQETVSARVADPAPPLRDRRVALVVQDARAVRDRIGEGTTDDDRTFAIRAEGDVAEHVQGVVAGLAEGWGVRLGAHEDGKLRVEILRFWVHEQNQAVGSTYVAEVRLAGSLEDASGRALWRGEVGGEARRYGRKRSRDNANEVLSDALKEASASLIEMPGWRAWGARTAPEPAASIDPDVLLRDLKRLQEQALDLPVLVAFARQRPLSRPLTADEVSAWRAAGIPQEVVTAALERAPATAP